MGKKKDINPDLASFFGDDDLDWLDDPSQEVGIEPARAPEVDATAAPPPEPEPAAPAPPPVAAGQAVQLEPMERKDDTPAEVDADLPTQLGEMVNDEMPTQLGLPPGQQGGVANPLTGIAPPPPADRPIHEVEVHDLDLDMDDSTEVAADDEVQFREVDDPFAASPQPSETPQRAEVELDDEDLSSVTLEEDWGDDEPAAFADDFEDPSEEVPLVRTPEPAAARDDAPVAEAEGEEELAFTAPGDLIPVPDEAPEPAAQAPLASATALDDWESSAAALLEEAQGLEGEARGRLEFEAGLIYRWRLGDVTKAWEQFQSAVGHGAVDAEIYREIADLAAELGGWEHAYDALSKRAALLEGTARAEAEVEAAGIARNQLGSAEHAANRLRAAIEAQPDDYASLVALGDQLAELGDSEGRSELLAKLAEVSDGPLEAEAWWRQGQVLVGLGRNDDAVQAFRAARAADAGLVPAFQSLETLFRQAGDHAGLAALYAEEAERAGQSDRGWWALKAARAFHRAGNDDAAAAQFDAAVGAAHPAAAREQQAFLMGAERWEALAKAIQAEVDSYGGGSAKAYALYRLGQAHARNGATDEALTAWKQVLEEDSEAAPAAEAIAGLLQRAGRVDELASFWESRIETTTDEDARVALLFRLGEVAETAGDNERAHSAYERVLALRGDFLPALEAQQRTATRLERWTVVAELHERRAGTAVGSSERAMHLARAGEVWFEKCGDPRKAREVLEQSLQADPAQPLAVDALTRLLESVDDWVELGATLRRAGEATSDPAESTSLLYRSGRVYAEKTDDSAAAVESLRACLMAQPDFLPAVTLLKDLASRGGGSEEVYRLHKTEADSLTGAARHWRLLAAAEAASGAPGLDGSGELSRILEEDPGNQGALATLEVEALRSTDRGSLIDAWRRALDAAEGEDRSAWVVRITDALEEAGDSIGAGQTAARLADLPGDARPLRAAARMAGAQSLFQEAVRLLEGLDEPEDRLERARLLARRLGQGEAAKEIYSALLEDPDARLRAAIAASRVARETGDIDTLVRAYGQLAEHSEASALRAAYAAWTGAIYEGAEQLPEALTYYRMALELRPGSESARDAIRRILIDQGDADGLKDLLASDPRQLAEALEQAGATDAAAEVWSAHASRDNATAADWLYAERALAAAGEWLQAYGFLTKRREAASSSSVRDRLDAQRRWVLGEKLSETDEAWELYQELHEQNPSDREVTETLARIAGSRGEIALGVQYLEELASSAETPEEAARYRRRCGEIHENNDNVGEARQAYLDALDHLSSDLEALAGLKRLAEREEDWPALIDVVRREAAIAEGEARLEKLREVATSTEAHISDRAVAIDAWRAVLDAAPNDYAALEAVVRLSEEGEQWTPFVEAGAQFVGHLGGADKTSLLRRLGEASQELGRDDAIQFFERAVTEGPPDLKAAQELERLCRQFGDLQGAVRCLTIQAEVLDSDEERVKVLSEAAAIEANMRHDRDAATALYRQVLELAPDDEKALSYIAESLVDAGAGEDALPIYERLEPHMKEGKDLDDFDVRMEVANFFFTYASLLHAGDRLDEALPRFDRALELNPTHLPTLEAVGPLYMDSAQWKKAERVYRQLLQLTGGHGDKEKVANTYTRLGLVERELGNLDKAAKRFNKALELHPNHLGALKGLALVLEDRGDWNTVLNFYNNIIYHATVPEDVVNAYMTKGRILDEHMGREDKAAQHYERSLAFDANQPVALLRLAELALRRQDWAEAGGLVQRGLQLATEPGPVRAELLLGWAIARKASGADDAAKAALVEAFASNQDLKAALGDDTLDDLEQASRALRERLPK